MNERPCLLQRFHELYSRAFGHQLPHRRVAPATSSLRPLPPPPPRGCSCCRRFSSSASYLAAFDTSAVAKAGGLGQRGEGMPKGGGGRAVRTRCIDSSTSTCRPWFDREGTTRVGDALSADELSTSATSATTTPPPPSSETAAAAPSQLEIRFHLEAMKMSHDFGRTRQALTCWNRDRSTEAVAASSSISLSSSSSSPAAPSSMHGLRVSALHPILRHSSASRSSNVSAASLIGGASRFGLTADRRS